MSTAHPEPVTFMADQVIQLLTARAEDLGLDPATLASIRPDVPVPAAHLPVLKELEGYRAIANTETAGVVDAVLAAAPHLPWRQTYSADDGFAGDYLDRYGWFDLAGPTGPYTADGVRIMIGCWGKGIVYPDHSHPPDEHYFVLAGGALFRLGDDPWQDLGPGEVFHTPAHSVHSADMSEKPLMALSIWRTEDHAVRINLTDDDRDVVLPD